MYDLILKLAATEVGHFVDVIHKAKGQLRYSALEWMQKEILMYINMISMYDTEDTRLIVYLTKALNLISDLLFK